MTDPEQDDVFDAYLKRRAVLPALEDQIEPPAALDEAVLARAREAIRPGSVSRSPVVANADVDDAAPVADTRATRAGGGTPNGVAKLPTGRPPRGAVPVALAAIILLCLSVVMNVSLDTNRSRSSPNLARMAAARADSKASALSNATAESNAAAGVDAPASGAAHDQFADNGERPQSVSGEIASSEVVLPRAKVVGVPAPRAPIVVESAAAPNASSADAGEAAVAAHSGAGEPRAAAAAAADKAVMMAKRAGVAAPEYTPAPEAARAAGERVAMREAAVVARAGGQATKSAVPPAGHPADPKLWLQQIGALRAVGKKDQADAEMVRFKKAFPDYAIPTAAPAASDLSK